MYRLGCHQNKEYVTQKVKTVSNFKLDQLIRIIKTLLKRKSLQPISKFLALIQHFEK